MSRKMTEREKWIIKKANAHAAESRAKKIIQDSRNKKDEKINDNNETITYQMTDREKMIIKKADAQCSVIRARKIIQDSRQNGDKK